VPPEALSTQAAQCPTLLLYYIGNQENHSPKATTMFEELWSEIQDAPGEIFDIPELFELRDEEKFNVNEYLNSNIDY
jgi:hypothetical protein